MFEHSLEGPFFLFMVLVNSDDLGFGYKGLGEAEFSLFLLRKPILFLLFLGVLVARGC